MARAVLITGLFATSVARAQPFVNGQDGLPEESLGIQLRGGASALVGEGAGDVDQPPLTYASASLQVRVLPDWYLELTTYGERTLRAEAPQGKTPLGIEGNTAGVRWRPRRDAMPRNRLVVGAGAGGARVFVQGKGVPGAGASFGGAAIYAFGGIEREVYGDGFSAGYVGIEGVMVAYAVGDDSPFRGVGATVRVTFSYFMGGTECSDCL